MYNRKMWLGLLGLHLIGNTGYNLILRRSLVNNVDKLLLAAIMQTSIFIPIGIYEIVNPIHFSHFTANDWYLVLADIVLVVLFQIVNVKALQYLEASVFPVIYNIRIIFTTLLGILLLSENVTLVQMLGGVLLFCAIFVVKQKSKKGVTKSGILWGLSCAVVISVLNFVERELNLNVGFLSFYFPTTLACSVILWSLLLIRGRQISFSFFRSPASYSLMGFRAISAYGFSYALAFGPLALSSFISSLGVILTVLCGVLFLGERDYLKNKIFAVILAVIGLSLILLKV